MIITVVGLGVVGGSFVKALKGQKHLQERKQMDV